MGLIDDAMAGDVRAVARLASLVETDSDQAREIQERVYPHSGRARTIGVTGPPGAGKSTLVNRLIAEFRDRKSRVGVIAVDPSSPLSGGAALGDRIRMLERYDDPGVFIRSMASRGKLGGLAAATPAMIHLLDASGYDVVIVETVGIGQEEIDISRYVDSTLLVQVPGLGDAIQAMKAGILEVADIYVVNKADLDGADATAKEIRAMLSLGAQLREAVGWSQPVVKVSAKEQSGVTELVAAIDAHMSFLNESGELQRRRIAVARREVQDCIDAEIRATVASRRIDRHDSDELMQRVADRRTTPERAAETILEWMARQLLA